MRTMALAMALVAVLAARADAQDAAAEEEPSGLETEIYGFAMLDVGLDLGQIGDPNWQDTLRPTQLPAFDDQYGEGARWFAGVRQSRIGIKNHLPTDHGDLDTKLEIELFGVGPDEGQTTLRLRHAYAQLGPLLAGQTWSPFMDIDVFPNSIEYWGPPGMAFFRNVQLAYMPVNTDATRVTVALERPGASADPGQFADRVELEDVVPRFPLPDLSAEGRVGGPWGYAELAGIVRYIRWDDLGADAVDLEGEAIGWGVSASGNLKVGPHVLRAQVVYGEGIQNYMNDATADIGLEGDEGVTLPLLGLVGFADLTWSDQLSTAAGYSMVYIDNSSGQTDDAFHIGHYALANLLFKPVPDLMLGPEVQWGRRENAGDGYTVDDVRIQVSVKGSFAVEFGSK